MTLVGRRPRAEVLQRLRGKAACMLLPHAEPDGSGAEGLGLCLLEAMGQGTPAIGNATGGVPEALGPGLLLADPDDVQGAATTIRAWIKGGDRGAEGHAWVRAHHGPERAAAAVLEALA
ncbi:MAG: glycosyltransferase [Deltaproteobacteria bacterium]|nr:glycosyltransferase [Deltaproteobacteria bacterium]